MNDDLIIVRHFCLECGQEFKLRSSGQKYCSKECFRKHNLEHTKLTRAAYLKDGSKQNDRPCIRCGKIYSPTNWRQIYCSKKCNADANREKAKAWIINHGVEKYKRKKNAGICIHCQKPSINGKVTCQSCNDRQNEYQKALRKKLKYEVLKEYGGACICCGETEPAFLCIDHINNDGSEHRKNVRASIFYSWLRKNNFPKDNFQILCWNCNLAKQHYGVCPHQTKNDK